jgi:gluconate 2-dehydrogenase alpha chain
VIRATLGPRENERRQEAHLRAQLERWLREAGAAEVWQGLTEPQAVSTHAYGGTRMGTDPATSVVDGHGIAHEVPNLAVIGASCFPSAGGVNPTLTVEALALRTADHVIERWRDLAP